MKRIENMIDSKLDKSSQIKESLVNDVVQKMKDSVVEMFCE